MKTRKLVLSAVTILVAVGSSFAFNSAKRANVHPIYTTNGHFSGCYNTANSLCGTSLATGDYYTVNGTEFPATARKIDRP